MSATFIDRVGGALLFPFFALYVTDHFGVGMILADQLNEDMYTGSYPLSSADEWKIEECSDRVIFDTWMDNFDMWWFLEEIGVKNEHIPPREN